MDKFNNIKSIPAYISLMNIDTDKIIPKQFLKTIKRTGLGKNLFFEMRYDNQGNEIFSDKIGLLIARSLSSAVSYTHLTLPTIYSV